MSVHRRLSVAKRTLKTTYSNRVEAKFPLRRGANPASCSTGRSSRGRLRPRARPEAVNAPTRASSRLPLLVHICLDSRDYLRGLLLPLLGFIVTNMAWSAENVIAFYNKRGTCEQWIKEGKRSNGRGYRVSRSPPTPSVSSFMRWLTISAISCARWRRPSRSRISSSLRASAEKASTRQNCAAPLAFQASNQNDRLSVRSWCYIKAEWRCLGTEFTVGTGQTRRAGSSG
jgi:hypothetical protein